MKWDEISIRIAEYEDQSAFKELYDHFFPGILSFAQSFLKNREQAEEVASDVFIFLWKNKNVLPTIKSLPYYLYVATRHGCLNMLKKERRYNNLSLDATGEEFFFSFSETENNLVQTENLSLIETAINNLPPKCRLVFRLIKEEDLKYKEVAALLELSEKTVEAHMALAIRKVVEQLQSNLPEFRSFFSQKRRQSK